jgi:hypothetical protein
VFVDQKKDTQNSRNLNTRYVLTLANTLSLADWSINLINQTQFLVHLCVMRASCFIISVPLYKVYEASPWPPWSLASVPPYSPQIHCPHDRAPVHVSLPPKLAPARMQLLMNGASPPLSSSGSTFFYRQRRIVYLRRRCRYGFHE